jgi:hypothetical protein
MAAARTIAQRGVQAVDAAQGNAMERLVPDPTLAVVVGGVDVLGLSGDERGAPESDARAAPADLGRWGVDARGQRAGQPRPVSARLAARATSAA